MKKTARELNELLKKWDRLVKQYKGANDIPTEAQMRAVERELPETINLEEAGVFWVEEIKDVNIEDGGIIRRQKAGNINIYGAVDWCKKNDAVCYFQDAH